MMSIRNTPSSMPAICGRVRKTPKFTPDTASMMLLGPGVTEVTKPKGISAAMVASGRRTVLSIRHLRPLHRLGTAGNRGDAGARDVHQAQGPHQINEGIDLGGGAGDLEHKRRMG